MDPPPNRIPKIADGTLVRPSELAVKSMHGVAVPKFAYDVYKVDLGTEPPKIVGTYVNLVPQVGADGNELAGVRLPELQAPVATYTGWNLRDPKIGFPEYRASFVGSFIAWPKSEIAALYRSADEYLGKFAAATLTLVKERFLVADDAVNVIDRGVEEFKWATK